MYDEEGSIVTDSTCFFFFFNISYVHFFQFQIDPELAATQLQRVYRGYLSRREAERDRDAELVFIGMRPAENTRILEVCGECETW